MEAFEASESIANTGTGARREGEDFERLIARLWLSIRGLAEAGGATVSVVAGARSRRYAKLTVGTRSVFVPTSASDGVTNPNAEQSRWLEVVFGVTDLIAAFPTEVEAVRKYAPEAGPYAGPRYPTIYNGLTTKFDDTVVLVDGGVLREKILLEYKTAKSSAGRQIDGNAHERLSFQIMQYLEVATHYTKCSLMVMANGAFIRYRNKYHVNFHVQADRLKNFAWFSMEHACTTTEYTRFLTGLLSWLFEGTPREQGSVR
ncbi:MAG: hypothetical protein AMXMBFR77_11320 [Phycisphaerales bacterium]|nr:hypothetical protein [Leptolyngbya sp.]GIK18344.1 MAG: hypothetical protein BroJett004_05080 [Planctomycetota bacterium]